MTRAGFAVMAREVGNTAARTRAGIAGRYGCCRTALVGGYAIEGHVPAADVGRLLAHVGRRDRCDVMLLGRDGSASVFSRYG